MRITVPTVVGVEAEVGGEDRLLDRRTMFFSYGVIVSERASATAMFATWLTGTSEP